MSEEPAEYIIPCSLHPAERATHNCMHCAKPLCMLCVRERGYYCSDACKTAVQATVPSAPRDPSLDKVEAQVERSVAVAGTLFRNFIKLSIVLVVLAAGYYTVRILLAPKGQVTSTFSISSEMGTFRAEIAGPNVVIVQANAELFRLNLTTQQKEWSRDLAALDDPSRFVTLHDGNALVQSRSQRLAFDAQTGQQQWTAPTQPGTLWGAHLVTIQRVATKSPTPAHEDDDDEITAGDPEQFTARQLLGLARGESSSQPPAEFVIRFQPVRDGATPQEVKLTLAGNPSTFIVGDQLAVAGGRQLALFDSAAQLVRQITLPADILQVVRGGNTLAVATDSGVVALDAQTGRERWARTDLAATQIAAGPDDAVYVQFTLAPAEAKQKAGTYRNATVTTGGSGSLLSQVSVLLKLDARDGQTRWGVRNIGEHILFAGNKVFVADATEQVDLLASAGLFQGYYSVRQLNPRNGADVWSYVAKGILFDARIMAESPFLITATDPPTGRRNPTCVYELQTITGK